MNLSSNCTYQEVIERLLELADLDSAERTLVETKLIKLGEDLKITISYIDMQCGNYRQDLGAKLSKSRLDDLQYYILGR